MPSLDDDIDALYRLAPGDFTAARNALAKRAGDRASEIRGLAKPSTAAWAVNQVYWHDRPTFDALARMSAARRAAHVRHLRGERANHAVADVRYQAALAAAIDSATRFLHAIGDAVAPATSDAVTRTLEAVPADEIRGRLVRPIEPAGFSMLASLMGSAGPVAGRNPANVVPMPRGTQMGTAAGGGAGRSPDTSREQKAKRDAHRRERDRLRRELAAARAAERKTGEALTAARQALGRSTARVDRLERDLADARRLVTSHHQAADEARLAQNDAAASRAVIERRLEDIDEA